MKDEIEECFECKSKNLKKGVIWVCQDCGESCSDEIASEGIAKLLDECIKINKPKLNL